MSAQINLYHSRFLKQRDLLSLGNVGMVAATLYLALAALGGWSWHYANARKEAATAAEAELKSMKEQLDAATAAAAIRKPNPQLATELERAEVMLRRRGEIARLLESGVVGSTGGFADFLRGFARQVPEGLWLTGFTIGSGGNDMEIRGSMLNPAALPEYIRRLGAEKVFQGRSFAALTMNRGEPPVSAGAVVQSVAVPPAPTPAVRYIDFVLMPKLAEQKEAKP